MPVPEVLIAQKVISLSTRSAQPKGDTDRRDLKVLLLTYPQLRREAGHVQDRLRALGADDNALRQWQELVASRIDEEDPDAGY